MHRRITPLFLALAVSTLLTFGCRSDKEKVDNGVAGTDTSTETASTTGTTSTSATDTATTSTTAASGTTSTTGSASPTPLDDSDRKEAEKFALGDLGEVIVGKLVGPKATNPEVKSFADRLVSDHSKASDELKQIMTAKGLTFPTGTDAEHQKFNDELTKASGKDLDRKFVQDMVKDHDKDIKDFEKASKDVKDADLKAWVDRTLPVIKEHDKIAHDLEKKVK